MYEFSTHDEAGGIINAGDHLQIKSYRWAQDIYLSQEMDKAEQSQQQDSTIMVVMDI